MKASVRIGLCIIVALLTTAGAGFGAFIWRFTPDIPEASYPEPTNQSESRQQDLDYLRRFPEADLSFSPAQLKAFNALIDDLEEQVDTLSNAEFIMGVSAAGAIPENGHSGVSVSGTMNRLNSLPVRFAWFGDGLHIVRARAEHADLIGSRVAIYQGQSPEALYPKMDRYFGGNHAFLRQNSALFFAAPASLHAAGLIDQPSTIAMELVGLDGKAVKRSIAVEEEPTRFTFPSRYVLGKADKNEIDSGHDWRFLDRTMTEATWYGRHPEKVLWSDELAYGGVYWRMRNVIGNEATPVATWLEEQAESLRNNPADYLVLDLRANEGGDYTKAMSIARKIGELVKPEGRVYILADGDTFSAGIVTAYFALHGAGDRAVFVGQPMGDGLQFWAEGGGAPMVLPNSEIRLFASTGYHDWENGCSDWSRCFWINILFGVAIGPIEVELSAPLLFSDYARGIDSGIEAILKAEARRIGVK